MIKAIVFDWGGVLIDDPAQGLMEYCGNKLGVTADQLFNAMKPHFDDFQKGGSETELWEKTCGDLNISVPSVESLWGEAVPNVFNWREEVIAFAKDLKAKGYKVGFLSNTENPSVDFFHKTNSIDFDTTVFSCKERCAKPEKKIYDVLLEKLGTAPEETIFIDDKEVYCKGAQDCGIHTIQFQSLEQVKKELNHLL